MDKEFYFISGLPRSGSTLLSAILRQNPTFYADIASPVNSIILNIISNLSYSENTLNIDELKRKNLLKLIFKGYYDDLTASVVFDSSRHWTANTTLLKTLFPYTKIICCVRDISWILDSFERIAAKNCLYVNTLASEETYHCSETRCKGMMDPQKTGQVIKPWHHLKDGLALNPDMIHLVEYNDLCKNPENTLNKIYKFISKPYFEHDFNNIEYKNENFDKIVNMRDLHTVRKKVEWIEKKSILPKSVFETYNNMEFWRKKHEPIQY